MDRSFSRRDNSQISSSHALQYHNAPVPESVQGQIGSCVRHRNVQPVRSKVLPDTSRHETDLQGGCKAGGGDGMEDDAMQDSTDVPPVQEQTRQTLPSLCESVPCESVSCESVHVGGRSEETPAMEECSGLSVKAEDETMETTEQTDLSQTHEIARKLKDLNIADGCQENDLISS